MKSKPTGGQTLRESIYYFITAAIAQHHCSHSVSHRRMALALESFTDNIDGESTSGSGGPMSAQWDPPATMYAVMSCAKSEVEFCITLPK